MVKSVENLVKRKITGGRRIAYRVRRSFERDGFPVETTVGRADILKRRTRGGRIKLQLGKAEFANIIDPSVGKAVKSRVIRVLSNPANRDYERRGIITRGAVIETEMGKAKVVSRPSQDGAVNAILLK